MSSACIEVGGLGAGRLVPPVHTAAIIQDADKGRVSGSGQGVVADHVGVVVVLHG